MPPIARILLVRVSGEVHGVQHGDCAPAKDGFFRPSGPRICSGTVLWFKSMADFLGVLVRSTYLDGLGGQIKAVNYTEGAFGEPP